jgi:hypothetical protein
MQSVNTILLKNLIVKNATECLNILHPAYIEEYYSALGLCSDKLTEIAQDSPMRFLNKIQDTLFIRFFKAFDKDLIEYILEKSLGEFAISVEQMDKTPADITPGGTPEPESTPAS